MSRWHDLFIFMPRKEYTYVQCKWCAPAEGEIRTTPRMCSVCKNTGKAINPLEILCNMCGETMCPIGTMNEQTPYGLVDAAVTGGFESYHLLDMSCYEFSFCEKCLRQMFMQCKIKPYIHDAWDHPINGTTPVYATEYSWEEDQGVYLYRVWQTDGGFHQAYVNGLCNVEKDCPNKAIYTVLLSDEFTENCACEAHKERWSRTINAELVKFIPNKLKPFL